MKFTLEFDLSNDAFEGGPGAIAGILHSVARKVCQGYQCGIVSDENGNSIGRFQIEGDRT